MKFFHFSIFALCAALISCTGSEPDFKKARQVAEGALQSINQNDVEKVRNEFYSNDLVTVSGEDLPDKFRRLSDLSGKLISYTLKDSSGSAEIGEPLMINLTYEVKYDKVTTLEQFIISEQGDKYRITTHTVNN